MIITNKKKVKKKTKTKTKDLQDKYESYRKLFSAFNKGRKQKYYTNTCKTISII